jgi:hypothetical protein
MSKNRGTAKATDNLASTGRYKIVLLECALIMVHPSPLFVGWKYPVFNEAVQQEIYYYVNDFFQILSLVRFCYFIVSILNISIWKSRSAHRICKLYECEGGYKFAIRALMKVNPSMFNIVLFFSTMTLFTQALRVAEAPLTRVDAEMDLFSFMNSLWAVTMTMTTCKLL